MDYSKVARPVRCDTPRCKGMATHKIGVKGSTSGSKHYLCDSCLEGIFEIALDVLDRKFINKALEKYNEELKQPDEYFEARDIVLDLIGSKKMAFVNDIKKALELKGLSIHYINVCKALNLESRREGNLWLRYSA